MAEERMRYERYIDALNKYKLVQRMKNHMNGETFERYFGIEQLLESNVILKTKISDIILNDNGFSIKFSIYYSKRHEYKFANLPTEICELICLYASSYIILHFEIFYGKKYPFERPIWKFVNIEGSFIPKTNLELYYNKKVNYHNERYKIDWSPAMNIYSDMLSFFQKIYHFEYMIEE